MKNNNSSLSIHNVKFLLYQTEDGNIKIDVRLEDETVWVSQSQMQQLFQKSKATISEHIKNVFDEGELDEKVVVRNFRITTQHGAIKGKTQSRDVKHYNLDVIISVGYRVKSRQGTQFRIWATKRLKEYIIKGFALNDDRFKSGNSMNYFNELQERIREIRLSERFFYQKIKDIYATSIDYNASDEKTIIPYLFYMGGRPCLRDRNHRLPLMKLLFGDSPESVRQPILERCFLRSLLNPLS